VGVVYSSWRETAGDPDIEARFFKPEMCSGWLTPPGWVPAKNFRASVSGSATVLRISP
jgi:hypothetical protein